MTDIGSPEISIVSPVYRGEKLVFPLVKAIVDSLSAQKINSYEIVLVEDGSPDASWAKLEEVAEEYPKVVAVKLSRNFGQHSAISAGLKVAKGQYVVVMDCDLQDNPNYIGQMLDKCRSGTPVVLTRKLRRKHSWFKNISAHSFNAAFNWLADAADDMISESDVGTYSCLRREVVDAFNNMKDYHRHYLMIIRWLGFKTEFITVEHQERYEGESSYTFGKLVAHAVDGITSQSTKLLRLFVAAGFGIFILSLLAISFLVASYFVYGYKEGWTSLASLILLSTGMIVFSLGIVGLYVGQIFEQVRQRPLFVIEKIVSNKNKELPSVAAGI